MRRSGVLLVLGVVALVLLATGPAAAVETTAAGSGDVSLVDGLQQLVSDLAGVIEFLNALIEALQSAGS